MSRTVHALVSRGGRYLGAAPPFEVATPWWADVEPVTAHLDAMLGGPTAVLRLLRVAGAPDGRSGVATYHVEALGPLDSGWLDPVVPTDWSVVTRPQPLRMAWAEPGGPQRLVDWAVGELAVPPAGRPIQVKSWNLSCLYRLPLPDGAVWAKATAPFLATDAEAIRIVRRHDAGLAPEVLASDGHRSLLAEAPGIDCYQTDPATIRAVVTRWVAVQAAAADDADLAGLPSRRPDELAGLLAAVVSRHAGLDAAGLDAAGLIDDVPGLVAELDSAGLPLTLVHGDFHPGNWRSDGAHRQILDWGDCYLGHPAADVQRLMGWLPADQAAVAARAWVDAWRAQRPGTDPERALAPMSVLARVVGAIIYQRFLDHIEPDERIYHEDDPVTEVRAALAARDRLS
ncbi:MAG TPA: aminoglycoside phosphotransferase family protein [Jatrophihabitantaceae bacterium]